MNGSDLDKPDPGEFRPTRARYVVAAAIFLAAAIAYIPRTSLGVAEKAVREDLKLVDLHLFGLVLSPRDQMGWVLGAFFLTYALFQLPTGWLGHVWGTRRALPVFAVLWSLMSILSAGAPGFAALWAARLGMGGAQAGIFPCTTNTTAQWFPVTRRALISGSLASFMSVGGALGAGLTTWLLARCGPESWRWIFLVYGIPGLLWAAWFYWWFRDQPAKHTSVSTAELRVIQGFSSTPPAERTRELIPWGMLLSSPAMWWICGQQFFRAAGYIFFTTWFTTYLRESRGVPQEAAGYQTMLALLAVVLGAMQGGLVSDWLLARTGSRRLARQGLATASQLTCALLILLAYPIADAWLAVLIICAGSYFAALGGPCAYTITMDMGGRHITSVFSLMNMAGNVGAFVLPIVVPRLTGPQPTAADWDRVLFAFAGLYVAAALFWLLLNPNGTIQDQSLLRPHRE